MRVDPFKMAAQQLDPQALAMRLAQENINASGGLIREGSTEYLVRTLNEFQDLEEIENLAIARRGDATIRLRDVATVERTHAEREVISRLAGGEAVEVAIYREAGANIVDLAETVKRKVLGTPEQQAFTARLDPDDAGSSTWSDRDQSDYLAWRWRKDARFEVLSDQSTFIRAAVDDVKTAAILGAVLAVLVILAFLRRLSATLIIAVAIPISVIVTFAPMYVAGVSLNIHVPGRPGPGRGHAGRQRHRRARVDHALPRGGGRHRTGRGARGARSRGRDPGLDPDHRGGLRADRVRPRHRRTDLRDQALTVVTSLLVSLLVAVVFIPMLASRPWLAGVRWSGQAVKPRRATENLDWSMNKAVPSALTAGGRTAATASGGALRLFAGGVLGIVKLATILLWPFRIAFDGAWRVIDRVYPRLLSGPCAWARP